MRHLLIRSIRLLLAASALAWAIPAPPARAQGAGGTSPHEGMSNEELAAQLSNPVSSIWSLTLQNNMTFLRGDPSHTYRGQLTSNFQPALPFHLTDDWNLILRPVFSLTSTPVLDADGDWDRANGIGQTSVIALLSPQTLKGGLLWGVGPTAILPTTTRDELSQRKYALGPTAVALHLGKDWIYGIFPQYWWSVSGSGKRQEVSQANIQYFLWRSLGHGWQVGMSPNITYDRKADGPNAWTVPVGLGVQKTLRLGPLPLKIGLEGQAMVVHPDDFGQRWNLRFTITPVIPPLVKRNLF